MRTHMLNFFNDLHPDIQYVFQLFSPVRAEIIFNIQINIIMPNRIQKATDNTSDSKIYCNHDHIYRQYTGFYLR